MTADAAKPDTETVALEYDLPYPPAKVWRALTEPALLARWLMAKGWQYMVSEKLPAVLATVTP